MVITPRITAKRLKYNGGASNVVVACHSGSAHGLGGNLIRFHFYDMYAVKHIVTAFNLRKCPL